MLKELTILLENDNDDMDKPYDRMDDKNIPKIFKKRKKVLKLSDIK